MRAAAAVVSCAVAATLTVVGASCGSSSRGGFGPVDAGPDTTIADGVDATPPGKETRDPTTCQEARDTRSYVGCDYWPTVIANGVWSIFDFAVVVANVGATSTTVDVTGPSSTHQNVTIPAGEIRTIYLPWVPDLKGADSDSCGRAVPLAASVVSRKGAFHLVSTTPVIVYQFNALEYRGAGGPLASDGGAKDWSKCPGTTTDCDGPNGPTRAGCFSFSNDASLLLPSTAMTKTYRVVGQHGWTVSNGFNITDDVVGSTLAITATEDATHVDVHLASNATVLAGGGIAAGAGGATLSIDLDAGDVAELAGEKGHRFDLSGSLVVANRPIQLVSGVPCIDQPDDSAACDHVEESVPPAESLGKHYVVPVPTGPNGKPVGHVVRFFGNVDGTKLTYDPLRPARCPATLDAGQVVECDVVVGGFEVTGDHEFAVGSFLLGGSVTDPSLDASYASRGDPSATVAASVEQYRTRYLFLAPADYDVTYVDVVGTQNAGITLDGSPVTAPFEAVGSGGRGVYRVKIAGSPTGSHALAAKEPVAAQVVGYGAYTSYQVPAGLNLDLIAPPPIVK